MSQEQNKAVFDSGRQVEIKLQSAAGTKIVKVRFPTDEEWMERQRRRKIIIKQLGRGVSETVIPNSEDIDAALLVKLRWAMVQRSTDLRRPGYSNS